MVIEIFCGGSSFFSFFFLVGVVFGGGWLRTYFFRKQLLLSLLSLEFLVLSLFLGFVFVLRAVGVEVSVGFYLLVLGACEATLGLCLLVGFVRLLGRDMLRKVRLIKC